MRDDISWWQSKMFLDVFDALRTDFNTVHSTCVKIDNIESTIDLFVSWLRRYSIHTPGIEVKGYPVKWALTHLQEVETENHHLVSSVQDDDSNRLYTLEELHHLQNPKYPQTIEPFMLCYQELTLTPSDTDLSIYVERVIEYELQQLAPNRLRIEAICRERDIKEVRLSFEDVIRQILKTWPTAAVGTTIEQEPGESNAPMFSPAEQPATPPDARIKHKRGRKQTIEYVQAEIPFVRKLCLGHDSGFI